MVGHVRYVRQTTTTMPTTPGSISPPPVPVPDLDRVKIDVHRHIIFVKEYSNGQLKLGTRYVLTLAGNKIF